MRQSRVDNSEWTIKSGQSSVDNQEWTIQRHWVNKTQDEHNTETQKDEQHGSHQNPGAKPGASEW